MLRAPDLVGHALDGRYELLDVLGEGAFGRVYAGRDRRLQRLVAVKVIKPWWAEDSQWVARFQREAQLLARVSDPGIVQIFDFGDAEEGPYYVAELVEGESLAGRLQRGPLPASKAREVAEKLACALGSAHARGVLHCDVKPANVLLAPDGRVKVGDFGVARLAEGTSQPLPGTSQPLPATVAGTPRYMSPEQARGHPTTRATDVYSAGIVLYEMLAGEPPFRTGSMVELGLHHLQDAPPELPSHVPPALAAVAMRALAKDPAERYPDGAAMAAALRASHAPAGHASAAHASADSASVGHASASDAPADNGSVGAQPPTGPPTADLAGDDGIAAARPGAADLPADDGTAAASTAVIERPSAHQGRTIELAAAGVPRAATRRAPRVLAGDAPPPTPPGWTGARKQIGGPRRGRIALLAGVLFLAAGALTVLLRGGAGAQATVPDLRGLPTAGVRARARRTRVRPVFSRSYSTAAAGIATAQSPAPGTHVSQGSAVDVVLSAGPPPVRVPDLVGLTSSSAETLLAGAGLHYAVTLVAAPGSTANVVLGQSPSTAAIVSSGSTVALNVAEAPRWRRLTSFSGVDHGESVPFDIRGRRWRLSYSMSYTGTCLLLVTCLGPSAHAANLTTDSDFGEFELNEGTSQTHTFDSGPGLYRVDVSGGQDSARWAMTVEDYY